MDDKSPLIHRADGVTPTERYLKKLCDRTFLSLWSYPGIYRDQGRKNGKGDGKEVCDLLVVFEEHIIIFSDKACEFPNSDNIELNWNRWYKRAIKKSANQIWGAEGKIRDYPNRLFLDRSCTKPFPIELPDPSVSKVHRVVVAHGASTECIKHFGGSGSLMIDPSVIGDSHFISNENPGHPFVVGQIDPKKGYVHIFDDTTLEVVMSTLDTITDFVQYLTKKELLITSGKLGCAAGEDDLLAFYLINSNSDGEHDFVIPFDIAGMAIDEGFWAEFSQSPQRLAQIEANLVSYSWDRLIEAFGNHITAGTSYYNSSTEFKDQIIPLRFLAREPRIRRRLLARTLMEFIEATPVSCRSTRTFKPSMPNDPFYVFLLLPCYPEVPYDDYRKLRLALLELYCLIVKIDYPEANDIIGIATETGRQEGKRGSEDVFYVDARNWTPEIQAQVEAEKEILIANNLIGDKKEFRGIEKEYPDVEIPKSSMPRHGTNSLMKGRDRNQPCPCGSGKKVKKCCGR